jgi:predicted nuclease with TOPRIM domain
MRTEKMCIESERRVSMPIQEEKITVLEENISILLGIASRQERDIKSIQVGVMSLERRFDALEGRLYGMDHRLSNLEKRFDTLEQSVSSRFDTLEQNVNSRFGTLEQSVNSRFETQDKKLDQILLLLNTYISKPDKET